MNKEKILYIFMNNKFEFVDEQGDIVEDMNEATGYEDLERAREEKETFDEPQEWKIVKKRIIVTLEEIVDE